MLSIQIVTTIFTILTLVSADVVNTTAEYKLRTCVKPGQDDKSRFEGLYLSSYHVGAGESDAVFYNTNYTTGITGFLNATTLNLTTVPSNSTPETYQSNQQLFSYPGQDFPWYLWLELQEYVEWSAVGINAGSGTGYGATGYFINETGLQWTSTVPGENVEDAFKGWLVCDWWHGVPQLFVKFGTQSAQPTLANCADIWLIPVYV